MKADWTKFANFHREEFECRCGCGEAEMDHAFLVRLQVIRSVTALPMTITSGYRCPRHNAAVSSTGLTGPHTTGHAADIAIMGGQSAFILLNAAIEAMTGIGVSKQFIHLDDLGGEWPRPALWGY